MSKQIFVAVADGSQREWSETEKHLISQSPELIEQLKGWLENSLSDNCWHPENYRLIQSLTKPLISSDLLSTDLDKKIEIPF
ncbi:hypothetical protein [Nostoc sp. FACHB-280]|uniref:hypothetical protein n=1 Tax=Nostoc sp. FACHB-280 TaxID=2692839 RepID=UPI00168ABCA4|nr:hypothetical protein [Nostoc sp. FACHB-280]MBD2498728.1 hypothetical protein [Nostoc sp. FACHB-280]